MAGFPSLTWTRRCCHEVCMHFTYVAHVTSDIAYSVPVSWKLQFSRNFYKTKRNIRMILFGPNPRSFCASRITVTFACKFPFTDGIHAWGARIPGQRFLVQKRGGPLLVDLLPPGYLHAEKLVVVDPLEHKFRPIRLQVATTQQVTLQPHGRDLRIERRRRGSLVVQIPLLFDSPVCCVCLHRDHWIGEVVQGPCLRRIVSPTVTVFTNSSFWSGTSFVKTGAAVSSWKNGGDGGAPASRIRGRRCAKFGFIVPLSSQAVNAACYSLSLRFAAKYSIGLSGQAATPSAYDEGRRVISTGCGVDGGGGVGRGEAE